MTSYELFQAMFWGGLLGGGVVFFMVVMAGWLERREG